MYVLWKTDRIEKWGEVKSSSKDDAKVVSQRL